MARGRAEDAGGLTPAKDGSAALCHFGRRTLPILKCVDYRRLLPIICDFFLFYACVPVLIKYRETKRKRAQTLFPPI